MHEPQRKALARIQQAGDGVSVLKKLRDHSLEKDAIRVTLLRAAETQFERDVQEGLGTLFDQPDGVTNKDIMRMQESLLFKQASLNQTI